MADFRAPQHLFDAFVDATEEQKRHLRGEVVAWMKSIRGKMAVGDRVISPHPETGEEDVFERQPSRH